MGKASTLGTLPGRYVLDGFEHERSYLRGEVGDGFCGEYLPFPRGDFMWPSLTFHVDE